jgi:hypothetical protein
LHFLGKVSNLTYSLTALLYSAIKKEDSHTFDSNKYFSTIEKASVASYILASASVGLLSHWIGLGSFAVAGTIYLLAIVFLIFGIHENNIENKQLKKPKAFISKTIDDLTYIRKNKELKILLPIRMLNQVETILGILWLVV